VKKALAKRPAANMYSAFFVPQSYSASQATEEHKATTNTQECHEPSVSLSRASIRMHHEPPPNDVERAVACAPMVRSVVILLRPVPSDNW
jgi:hypothetical protein